MAKLPFVVFFTPFVGHKIILVVPFIVNYRPIIVCCGQSKKISGFTIVELMIAVVIMGILLSIATPSLHRFILNNRIVAQANELVGDLKYARTEAIRRGTNVAVCIGTETGCGGVTSWNAGRTIFVDANNNGAWNSGEEVLRTRERLEGENTLVFDVGTIVVFARTGLVAAGSGIFSLCDSRGASYRREIEITNTGIVRAAVDSSGTCS